MDNQKNTIVPKKKPHFTEKPTHTTPPNKRPPLGVPPRSIWEATIIEQHLDERLEDLKKSVILYAKQNLVISDDWINEYNHIIRKRDQNAKL